MGNFWRCMWYGKVFPVIPGRIYDHGKRVGWLGTAEEIAGKALAAVAVTMWETFRILARWQKGVLLYCLGFGGLWTVLGLAGVLQEPLGGILKEVGQIAFAISGGITLMLIPVGFLRARTPDRFPGMRSWTMRKLTGSTRVEKVTVNEEE